MAELIKLEGGMSLFPAENLKIVGDDIILGIEASGNRLRLSWIRFFYEHRKEYYIPSDRIYIHPSDLLEESEDYDNLLMLVLSYQQGALLGGRISKLEEAIITIGKEKVIDILNRFLAIVNEKICKPYKSEGEFFSRELIEVT